MPRQSAIKARLVLGAEPARDGTAFLKAVASPFLAVVEFAVSRKAGDVPIVSIRALNIAPFGSSFA